MYIDGFSSFCSDASMFFDTLIFTLNHMLIVLGVLEVNESMFILCLSECLLCFDYKMMVEVLSVAINTLTGLQYFMGF